MSELTQEIKRARSKWKFRGDVRPDFADTPGPGQESVWDYPRPPRIDPVENKVVIKCGPGIIADTTNSIRILETAGPPVYYIPKKDIDMSLLCEGEGSSLCEWKGPARYWTVQIGDKVLKNVGWGYPEPFPGYEQIKEFISFYPSRLECFINGERVLPQPGGFYGGWVTKAIVGPFKGEPGTEWW